MRSILHNLILASGVMASAVLVTNAAMAETIKVPFNFTAAGHSWPAGAYSVERDLYGSRVTLRSTQDSAKSVSFVLGPGAHDPIESRVTLRFDDLGSTHALQSVQYRSMITANLDKGTKQTSSAPRLSQGR